MLCGAPPPPTSVPTMRFYWGQEKALHTVVQCDAYNNSKLKFSVPMATVIPVGPLENKNIGRALQLDQATQVFQVFRGMQLLNVEV